MQKFELDARLFPLALNGFKNAYAPYSKFHVGAAILANNDRVYGGANVENAAYPQGNCAEASAISAMIFDGAVRIKEVLIMGRADGMVMPCGGCRQRISEFCDENSKIFIASPEGIQGEFSLDDLFPHRFGQDSLKGFNEQI